MTLCGQPSEVRLIPATTRTFTKVLGQNAAAFPMFLTVLMTIQTADYTEYELNLKFKLVFLLLLCYAFTVHSSLVICEQKLFKVFKFRNTHSKICEKMFACYLSDVLTESEILLPLLLLKAH